jgi:membrane associated rhomboid family serine protease
MTAPDQFGQGSGAEPGQQPPPVCYRHPGRETYVSCVRCGRYACPNCLRSAAVGQQCVECVRGANQGARQARTVFGGRPTRSATVTWTILGINVLLYLVELAHTSLANDWALLGYASPSGYPPYQGIASGQWYRLLTSAFLPGTGGLGFMDILFNMWALVFVGPGLEQLLGRVRFLGVYLLCAIGGGVMFYWIVPPNQPALGASGAIFGLFAAWFVVSRRLRLDTRGIVVLIAVNLAFGFIDRNIAWQDHLGGLIVGAAITAAYAYAPRKGRAVIQLGATVAVIAILIVAVMIRTAQIKSGAI